LPTLAGDPNPNPHPNSTNDPNPKLRPNSPTTPFVADSGGRATAEALPQSIPVARPRTVKFDDATEGTGTSILQSAMRRQQKKMERKEGRTLKDPQRDAARDHKKEDRSEVNVEYLESLHKRAKRKRQSTSTLPDIPPKDKPPNDRPPDPPPPVRDKVQLGGEQKSPRGAKKSRETSRLGTGPHDGL